MFDVPQPKTKKNISQSHNKRKWSILTFYSITSIARLANFQQSMTVITPKRRRTREEGGDNEVEDNKGKEERERVRSTRIRISDSTSTSSNSDHSQITTMNFSESDIDNDDSGNAQQTKWSVPSEW
jgi:hypothetical protein